MESLLYNQHVLIYEIKDRTWLFEERLMLFNEKVAIQQMTKHTAQPTR